MDSGFDKGIDYEPTKQRLIEDFMKQLKSFRKSGYTKRSSKRLIFVMIELIQLRNGSRITEAINAFKLFGERGSTAGKVVVKICKSETPRMKWVLSEDKLTKVRKTIVSKPRYREMMFPTQWLPSMDIDGLIAEVIALNPNIKPSLMKTSVCKYMQRYHDTNTHSLRYAFINYLIYEQKRPITDVAKFVGHSNVGQLVTYTQKKNSDQIFDLDI